MCAAAEKKYNGLAEQEFWSLSGARKLSGPYLLYGPEGYSKSLAVKRIVDSLEPAAKELNFLELENPSCPELLAACAQLPFFDEQRVVLVRSWDSSLYPLPRGRETSPRVGEDLLERVDPATVLLFVMQQENKYDQLYKGFMKWDEKHTVLFPELTESRAANLLLREAALKSVSLSPACAQLIVQLVGKDGFRLRNEFSKAADAAGPGQTVTEALIRSTVTPSSEFNAFKILDCLLAHNKRSALRQLKTALDNGESEFGLAALMENRLKLMLQAKALLASGLRKKDVLSQLGGSYYYQNIVEQAPKYSREMLTRGVLAFCDIDTKVKQGICASPREALMLAIYTSFE